MPTLRLRSVFFLVSLLSISVSAMAGTVIHVPGDQPTIQAGVDAAVDGDTVLVSPGTYYENINFNGKAITVTSEQGPAVTIIDGSNGSNTVVNFVSNETAGSLLSGFTIQNHANGYYGYISIFNASPTVVGNVIVGNPQNYGSGILVQSGSPVIRGNLIAATNGSGIASSSDTGMQITGNLAANNAGWGIVVNYSNGPNVLQQNTVVANSGGGIGSYSFGSPVTLVQNLVLGNAAVGIGLSGWTGTFTLVSNTVADNQPGCCGNGASEVQMDQVSDATTLQNNLIVATGTYSAFSCSAFVGVPIFINNDVFAGNNASYGGACPDLTGTSGNISADPLFVDLLSDNVHIQAGSPVINAGTNSPNEPAQDFDGDPRVAGSAIDIGIDEYSKKPTLGISPTALHFGPQNVGTSSPPQVVTLTNRGKTALALNLIGTGPNYVQNNNCGTNLPAGASCKINVTFSPASGGALKGVVGVFTGATANPVAVSLLGTGLAPQVQFYGPFSFYNQIIGTQSTQTGTLTNVGQAPLLITSIVLNAPADFVESDDCPIAPTWLAVGASCSVSVTFTPTIIGNQNGTLAVNDNAIPSPQTAYINGNSVSAGIPVLTPDALSFPPTLIGQSSPPQTATLMNTGSGAMGVTNIYSYGDFPQTNDCPPILASGASCTISVTFTPTQQGNLYGYVWVYTDSAYFQVSLSATGTGVAPVPTISSLSMSSIAAGSPDTGLTITGTGFTNATRVLWNGAQLPYSYSYGNTQINVTIPALNLANAGVSQIAVFTPQPGGGTSNEIPFTVYTPISYGTKSVTYKYRNITGTNLNLSYYSSTNITAPFPIQFGGGSFTTMTVGAGGTISFSNFATPYNSPLPTNQTQTLVAPFWANLYPFGYGNDNNVFWSVTGAAPNRVLVLEWRDVAYCCSGGTVRFEAVFFEGSSNIEFNYADTVFGGYQSYNDNGATATVGVQVSTALATQFSYNTPSLSSKTSMLWYPSAPTATVSTSSIDFGYHKIANASRAQKFTLTNGGLTQLLISDISISNPVFSQTNNCGGAVDPGKSCTFLVTFTPTQPVAETATLTITDNASNSPQVVSLSGIGAIRPIVVFPIQLNFGGVTVGQSTTLPVTLANAGNAKLTIQQIAVAPAVFTATNNCGAFLTPGASCTVNVTFTPAQVGNITGKLQMGLNGKPLVTESKLVGSGQ